jgi:hypothetical protein
MKVWHILKELERFEETMSNLYDSLRLRYESDPEAASFFARMRDEEIGHRDIVRYQRRIMFTTKENYMDLADFDQDALERVLHTVEDLIAHAAGLQLDEALRSSAALELEGTEQHYRSVVSRANPALGYLVENLGGADREHAARLGLFADSRGIALKV